MTSVEWLFEKLWQLPKDKFTWYNVLEEAKQMEKQQIIDAYYKIGKDNTDMVFPIEKDAEQYYNETYREQLKSK